jgi:hypothetical protein
MSPSNEDHRKMFKPNPDKPPPVNPANLSNEQLKNIIKNYIDHKMTGAPLFTDLLAEQERRKGSGLTFEKSLEVALQAAKEQHFICCKDIADANGAEWNKVHYKVNEHLLHLNEYCYLRYGIMISAIIVHKEDVATGKMAPSMIKGFTYAVEHLMPKDEITRFHLNPEAFYREQQKKAFEFAAAA